MAEPAPAPAPRTHAGGDWARNSADSASITVTAGTMKHRPPTTAPGGPARRRAQKMHSCVDAGPGSRLQAPTASSKSRGSIQWALVYDQPA